MSLAVVCRRWSVFGPGVGVGVVPGVGLIAGPDELLKALALVVVSLLVPLLGPGVGAGVSPGVGLCAGAGTGRDQNGTGRNRTGHDLT